MFAAHHPPLVPALEADRHETNGRAGRLSYYVAGSGRPILLLHSINAAGSAYEMRPIFERLRDTYRVYAVDLPGFGWSDRSARRYDVRLFVDAVHDMMDVAATYASDEAVHVTALSLAGEFAARAATERRERFRALSLITPTGFSRGSDRLRHADATRELSGFSAVFEGMPWSRPMYRLLTSRRSIRYFLQRTYGAPDIDEGLQEYAYLTARQEGAHHAPYAFLSGRLFSADIRTVYERLDLPVWLGHGTRGDFRDFSEAAWTSDRANWTSAEFAAGAMVHFEAPALFFPSYLPFVSEHA